MPRTFDGVRPAECPDASMRPVGMGQESWGPAGQLFRPTPQLALQAPRPRPTSSGIGEGRADLDPLWV